MVMVFFFDLSPFVKILNTIMVCTKTKEGNNDEGATKTLLPLVLGAVISRSTPSFSLGMNFGSIVFGARQASVWPLSKAWCGRDELKLPRQF
jgi:hypothetical protein